MRVAISRDGIELSEFRVIPTPQSYEDGLNEFRRVFAEIKNSTPIQKAAGGVSGALSKDKTHLLNSPHLPLWVGKPIKNDLEAIIGTPIILENDAAVVALGEAIEGAGKGFNIVAYLTVSTGVGGARIVGGKIDANYLGFEPGHQIVDADGTICPDCIAPEDGRNMGHLEDLVSGTAITKRFGQEPENIHDENIWNEMTRFLSFGVVNTILFWSPEVVILGGGVMESGKIAVENVKANLAELLTIFPEHPEIRRAELKDMGGLHGALSLLKA